MPRSPFECAMRDKAVLEEFRDRAGSPQVRARACAFDVRPESIRATTEAPDEAARPPVVEAFTEAIIMDFMRPALLIRNDSFQFPESEVWQNRLLPTRTNIERSIRSVGRLEVLSHPTLEWIGTAWMVSDNIAITNRHVANEFAQRRGDAFTFRRNPFGLQIRARVDFKEEFIPEIDPVAAAENELEVEVAEILHIEELGSEFPDLALIKLNAAHGDLPHPIKLSTRPPDDNLIAVIGYPARDSRNPASSLDQVFGDIYNVKRLAPGMIDDFSRDMVFTHDCSTLGGNSGSVVVDIDEGSAIGLHFGGRFQVANFAVKASVIESRVRELGDSITPVGPISGEVEEKIREVSEYDDRQGYQERFLGNDFPIPLPKLSTSQLKQAAEVKGGGNELKYTHFSVVMNSERRLAFFTACNINGNELRRFPRGTDKWYIDPRIDKAHQVDNVLYRANDLDRGHLVRRLDPIWGPQDVSELAQDNTFHYTNAAPQHKDLNRRIWLSLEDHILDNVDVHDLKVSVVTGPVFKKNDRMHRGVQIPREFWKVIGLVKEDSLQLSATAYVLSQANMISALEEFVFGPFRTFQVGIATLEQKTGLNFGNLRDHDPFITEAVHGRELTDPSQIVV